MKKTEKQKWIEMNKEQRKQYSGECDRCDPGDYVLPRVALLFEAG